jgi:hypothetical protein
MKKKKFYIPKEKGILVNHGYHMIGASTSEDTAASQQLVLTSRLDMIGSYLS